MECSTKVASTLIRTVVLAYLFVTSASAQISQIDPAKLPQNVAVQHAYKDLLPLDEYAQLSEAKWRYPVPKMQVIQSFLNGLHTLQRQQQLAPNNAELQVFTGLVAHLAYNLGIDEGDGLALDLLEPRANDDVRASWFLGMHQCQTSAPVAGMQRLLHIESYNVESSGEPLPGAFWEDYAICSDITNMPVHAVRAYDIAKKDPEAPPIDKQLEQSARDRIKPSSVTETYLGRQAWYPERTLRGNIVTSSLCGESFITTPASHFNFRDVGFGTCLVSIDTEAYPSRYGPSSASILVGSQVAKPGESLEAFAKRTFAAFAQGILKDPAEANQNALTGIQCPVATCLSFEIVTDKLYKQEGGAHLLAVFFQADQPEYPGIRYETPEQPRVGNMTGGAAFFRPVEVLQRFNGTLYMFVTLDANLDIYPRARADFDNLLKTLVPDTKELKAPKEAKEGEAPTP